MTYNAAAIDINDIVDKPRIRHTHGTAVVGVGFFSLPFPNDDEDGGFVVVFMELILLLLLLLLLPTFI